MQQNRQPIDPIFKRNFGIKTPIVYLQDLELPQIEKEHFNRSWKKFYKKAKSPLSDSRLSRFEAFFRQLEKDGSDERYSRRIEIRFIDHLVGYGVFAKEPIPPYSTLCHYTGVFKLDHEIDPDHDSTFSFTEYKTYSIDAAEKGNWARFMNHAGEKESVNNAIPWEYYHEKGPRIVFTSGPRGIKRGAQILYSYGDEYWEQKESICLLDESQKVRSYKRKIS